MTVLPYTVDVDLNGCARCHGEHYRLRFTRLRFPVDDHEGDFTHWSPCPTTGEPVLLRILDNADA